MVLRANLFSADNRLLDRELRLLHCRSHCPSKQGVNAFAWASESVRLLLTRAYNPLLISGRYNRHITVENTPVVVENIPVVVDNTLVLVDNTPYYCKVENTIVYYLGRLYSTHDIDGIYTLYLWKIHHI